MQHVKSARASSFTVTQWPDWPHYWIWYRSQCDVLCGTFYVSFRVLEHLLPHAFQPVWAEFVGLGSVERSCRVTAPTCSATCFPCSLGAHSLCCIEEAWSSGTASPIPWQILSVVLRKGKRLLPFSLPSSVGGGITVAVSPLDAFGCTDWAFPSLFLLLLQTF